MVIAQIFNQLLIANFLEFSNLVSLFQKLVDLILAKEEFGELRSYIFLAVIGVGKDNKKQNNSHIWQQILRVKYVQEYDENRIEIVGKLRILMSEDEKVYANEPLEVKDKHLYPWEDKIGILDTKGFLLFSIFNYVFVQVSHEHRFSSSEISHLKYEPALLVFDKALICRYLLHAHPFIIQKFIEWEPNSTVCVCHIQNIRTSNFKLSQNILLLFLIEDTLRILINHFNLKRAKVIMDRQENGLIEFEAVNIVFPFQFFDAFRVNYVRVANYSKVKFFVVTCPFKVTYVFNFDH